MIGKEIFEKAKQIIVNAHDKRDPNLSSLEDLGFEKKDLNKEHPSDRVPNDLYTAYGDDDIKVEVQHWAYDPSKPFQSPQPDINKVHLKIFEGEKVADIYSADFPDPPYGSI